MSPRASWRRAVRDIRRKITEGTKVSRRNVEGRRLPKGLVEETEQKKKSGKKKTYQQRERRKSFIPQQERHVLWFWQSKMRPALIMPLSSIKIELRMRHKIFCGAMQERGPLYSVKNKGCGWKIPAGANCNISGPGTGKKRRKASLLIKRREAFSDWTAGERTKKKAVKYYRSEEIKEAGVKWNTRALGGLLTVSVSCVWAGRVRITCRPPYAYACSSWDPPL